MRTRNHVQYSRKFPQRQLIKLVRVDTVYVVETFPSFWLFFLPSRYIRSTQSAFAFVNVVRSVVDSFSLSLSLSLSLSSLYIVPLQNAAFVLMFFCVAYWCYPWYVLCSFNVTTTKKGTRMQRKGTELRGVVYSTYSCTMDNISSAVIVCRSGIGVYSWNVKLGNVPIYFFHSVIVGVELTTRIHTLLPIHKVDLFPQIPFAWVWLYDYTVCVRFIHTTRWYGSLYLTCVNSVRP